MLTRRCISEMIRFCRISSHFHYFEVFLFEDLKEFYNQMLGEFELNKFYFYQCFLIYFFL